MAGAAVLGGAPTSDSRLSVPKLRPAMRSTACTAPWPSRQTMIELPCASEAVALSTSADWLAASVRGGNQVGVALAGAVLGSEPARRRGRRRRNGAARASASFSDGSRGELRSQPGVYECGCFSHVSRDPERHRLTASRDLHFPGGLPASAGPPYGRLTAAPTRPTRPCPRSVLLPAPRTPCSRLHAPGERAVASEACDEPASVAPALGRISRLRRRARGQQRIGG